jgi:hypothetical protein
MAMMTYLMNIEIWAPDASRSFVSDATIMDCRDAGHRDHRSAMAVGEVLPGFKRGRIVLKSIRGEV